MQTASNQLVEAGKQLHPHQLDLFGGSQAAPSHRPAFPVVGEADRSEHGLYHLCHDMRTALNAILGFSEIMTQKLHGPLGHPKYEEYAAHVRYSGQALLTVSDEVLSSLAQAKGRYTGMRVAR